MSAKHDPVCFDSCSIPSPGSSSATDVDKDRSLLHAMGREGQTAAVVSFAHGIPRCFPVVWKSLVLALFCKAKAASGMPQPCCGPLSHLQGWRKMKIKHGSLSPAVFSSALHPRDQLGEN